MKNLITPLLEFASNTITLDTHFMENGFYFKFNTRDATTLLIALFSIELLFTMAYFLDSVMEVPTSVVNLFDLDGEATIPAWFSSGQLLLVGVIFLFSSDWAKGNLIAHPWFLVLTGIAFIFLSIDETAVIHERVTKFLKDEAWAPRFKGDHGIWIPVYLSAALLFAAFGLRTIFSFFKAYALQSLLLSMGLTLFLIGGVGLEIVSYWYLRGSETLMQYKIEVALEEFLEMAGMSIILYGTILCALRKPFAHKLSNTFIHCKEGTYHQ